MLNKPGFSYWESIVCEVYPSIAWYPFFAALMSILCTLHGHASEEHASKDGAIDIEDFIRLYYGEVGVDDFIELYNGRQDLKRVAYRVAPATSSGRQTRSSSFDTVPALAGEVRNRAMTYRDDDVRPINVICV